MNINNENLVTTVTFDFGSVEKTLDVEDVATAFVRLFDDKDTIARAGGCVFIHMGHDICVTGGGSDVVRIAFEDARELVDEHSFRTLEA